MKELDTHSTRSIYYNNTICVCSYKQNSSWVASYIHACTNETYSLANLQDLISTLARLWHKTLIVVSNSLCMHASINHLVT